MYKPLDPLTILENLVDHHVGTHHVGLEKYFVRADTSSDVGFCCKVDDRVYLLDQFTDDIGVAHVTIAKMKTRIIENVVRQVVHVTCVGQCVEHINRQSRMSLHEGFHEVRADESRSSCYQNRVHRHYLVKQIIVFQATMHKLVPGPVVTVLIYRD